MDSDIIGMGRLEDFCFGFPCHTLMRNTTYVISTCRYIYGSINEFVYEMHKCCTNINSEKVYVLRAYLSTMPSGAPYKLGHPEHYTAEDFSHSLLKRFIRLLHDVGLRYMET